MTILLGQFLFQTKCRSIVNLVGVPKYNSRIQGVAVYMQENLSSARTSPHIALDIVCRYFKHVVEGFEHESDRSKLMKL